MHLTMEQIRKLADCYVNNQVLDDTRLASKKHMADCEECYKTFCTEYLLVRKLKETGILPEEFAKESIIEEIQKVFLQIKKAGEYLNIQSEGRWSFMYMPQMAAARGNSNKENSKIYVNKLSEYSSIRQEEGKIIIQLDGDVFSIERLRVRVVTDEDVVMQNFHYDEEVECYCVVIDEGLLSEDAVIEIVEV